MTEEKRNYIRSAAPVIMMGLALADDIDWMHNRNRCQRGPGYWAEEAIGAAAYIYDLTEEPAE